MSIKITTISDPSLFSGSSDLFRTALGGYYTTEETDDGQMYSFSAAALQSPASEYFDRVFFDVENQTTADFWKAIKHGEHIFSAEYLDKKLILLRWPALHMNI